MLRIAWYKKNLRVIIVSTTILVASRVFFLWWSSPVFMPKPVGYKRIELPVHHYVTISKDLPYRFEISQYATLQQDTTNSQQPYWQIIHYPQWVADIHLTYYPLHQDTKLLRAHLEDVHTLLAPHQERASAITEDTTTLANGNTIFVANLEGEVASQCQFYITDQQQHFLRGALYFRTKASNAYLAPIIVHIKEDIQHLLHTLTWQHIQK